MIQCPVCRKEVSELDESCPYCGIEFDDTVTGEKYKNENLEGEDISFGNAKCLNIMAYINITLSIVAAILIWINFSISKITDEVNLLGIFGGIAILIMGFTSFFLLKTIVDIYRKVENNGKKEE